MTDSNSILSRRQLLCRSASVPGMIGAAVFLAQQSNAEAAGGSLPQGCHFAPRAKRVIHLFMNGGPFQADLFDPKPALVKLSLIHI